MPGGRKKPAAAGPHCPACGEPYDPEEYQECECPGCGKVGSTACCCPGGNGCLCPGCEEIDAAEHAAQRDEDDV